MLILRIQIFLKSLLFHIWGGFPKSTTEEIKYRYEICLTCENFDKIKFICNICGCNIENRKKFLNKLAWADQECPVGKWQKIIRK